MVKSKWSRLTAALGLPILGLAVLLFAPIVSVAQAQQPSMIRIAKDVEPPTLDPKFQLVGRRGTLTFALYDTLLSLDEDMNVVGSIAESWEQIDPTRYRFHIRDGIVTHAGNAMDAANVAAWISDWQTSEDGRIGIVHSWLPPMTGEVVDRLTLDVVLEEPFAPLLRFFAIPQAAIWDAARRAEIGATAFSTDPSGTGPFRLKTWQQGVTIVVEANNDYFREGPFVDEIHYLMVPDRQTRVVAFESGDIDIVHEIPDVDIARIEARTDRDLYRQVQIRTGALQPNIHDPILSDIRVRRGLAHALDADEIVMALGQTAEGVNGLFTDATFGVKTGLVYEYDTELAESLLNEAGWFQNSAGWFARDGQTLTLKLATARGRYPLDYELAEMVELQLRNFGVQVEIDLFESTAWLSMARSQMVLEPRPDYQLLGWFFGVRTGVPTDQLEGMWVPGGNFNSQQYDNPEFTALARVARTAATEEEMIAALQEMQQILYDDVVNWVFFAPVNVIGVNSRIDGFWFNPADVVRMNELRIR